MEKDETRFRVSQKGTHDHRWRRLGLFQPSFTFKYHGFLNRAIRFFPFGFTYEQKLHVSVKYYSISLHARWNLHDWQDTRTKRTRRAPEEEKEEEEEAERRTVRSSPSFTARSHWMHFRRYPLGINRWVKEESRTLDDSKLGGTMDYRWRERGRSRRWDSRPPRTLSNASLSSLAARSQSVRE